VHAAVRERLLFGADDLGEDGVVLVEVGGGEREVVGAAVLTAVVEPGRIDEMRIREAERPPAMVAPARVSAASFPESSIKPKSSSRTVSCSPALRPMTLGSTVVAPAGTVRVASGLAWSSATIAVVSFVVLASGILAWGRRLKRTWRLSRSTRTADLARTAGTPSGGWLSAQR
jgi:hypothetical protein